MPTPKIIRWYPDFEGDFRQLLYTRGIPQRLHLREIFDRGFLIQKLFYVNVSRDQFGLLNFTDKVVQEDIEYHLPEGAILHTDRTTTIKWINEDESTHSDTKILHKEYDPVEQIDVATRRRQNVIKFLLPRVAGLLIQATGRTQAEAFAVGQQFAAVHQSNITLFREFGAGAPLIDGIASDTFTSWLDDPIGPGITMREFVIQELSI